MPSSDHRRRGGQAPIDRNTFACRAGGVWPQRIPSHVGPLLVAAPAADGHESDSSSSAADSVADHYGPHFVSFILLTWAAGVGIGFESALVVLVLASFLLCVIGFRSPVLGLIGIAALCTLEPMAGALVFTGGLLRWNTVNYWLLILLIVFSPFVFRLTNPHSRFLKALVALMALEVLISPDVVTGTQQVIDCAVPFAMLVYFTRASHDDRAWFWMGVVSGTLAAAGGLIFYLQVDGLPPVNRNVASFFPVTALLAICLSFRSVGGDWRRQLVLGGLAIANTGWVFLSGSRGSLLITIWCLLFLLIEIRSLKRQLLLVCASGLVALVMVTMFTDLQEYSLGRIELLFDDSQDMDRRTSGRSDLVAGAWQMFRDHPFGVGTGGFARSWAGLTHVSGQRDFFKVGVESAAHAGWMMVLAENGFIGFMLMAGYVGSFAVVGWRRRHQGMLGLGLAVTAILSFAYTANQLDWRKGLWLLAIGATTLMHRESLVAELQPVPRRRSVDVVRPRRGAPPVIDRVPPVRSISR
jgi:O-antigen ligase